MMVGILDKVKGIFGKKEVEEDTTIRRIVAKKVVEENKPEEFVPRYKLAQKMREDKEIDTPIVKRKRF